MSAWMFGAKGMHRVVYAIQYAAKNGCPTPLTLLLPGSRVGLELLTLNYKALDERYEDRVEEYFGKRPERYTYVTPPPLSVMQMFKTLQCFVYQCSEGDVVNTPRYEELIAIEKWFGDRVGFIPDREERPLGSSVYFSTQDLMNTYDACEWG